VPLQATLQDTQAQLEDANEQSEMSFQTQAATTGELATMKEDIEALTADLKQKSSELQEFEDKVEDCLQGMDGDGLDSLIVQFEMLQEVAQEFETKIATLTSQGESIRQRLSST
jgi:predicted  nucleic acid-binding Zn-ribbon protein